jgi:hypothetical protein
MELVGPGSLTLTYLFNVFQKFLLLFTIEYIHRQITLVTHVRMKAKDMYSLLGLTSTVYLPYNSVLGAGQLHTSYNLRARLMEVAN